MIMRPRHFCALLLTTLILSGCGPAPEQTVGTLSGQDLMARLDAGDAPLILDVRTPAEYAAGHIPGAVNIPHDALGARLAELGGDRDREIVVHCQSGRRAATAEELLTDAGYTGVAHLDGDMVGWRSADLPVVKTTAP